MEFSSQQHEVRQAMFQGGQQMMDGWQFYERARVILR